MFVMMCIDQNIESSQFQNDLNNSALSYLNLYSNLYELLQLKQNEDHNIQKKIKQILNQILYSFYDANSREEYQITKQDLDNELSFFQSDVAMHVFHIFSTFYIMKYEKLHLKLLNKTSNIPVKLSDSNRIVMKVYDQIEFDCRLLLSQWLYNNLEKIKNPQSLAYALASKILFALLGYIMDASLQRIDIKHEKIHPGQIFECGIVFLQTELQQDNLQGNAIELDKCEKTRNVILGFLQFLTKFKSIKNFKIQQIDLKLKIYDDQWYQYQDQLLR
jgi:hypothetical protein